MTCQNITEHQYCVNYDKSLSPGVSIAPNQIILDENDTLLTQVTVMLETPPNLVYDLGYDPYITQEPYMVAEVTISHEYLIFSPKAATFTVTSWFNAIELYFLMSLPSFDNETVNIQYIQPVIELTPTITIISPDNNYTDLPDEKKSVLGPLLIQVTRDITGLDSTTTIMTQNTKLTIIGFTLINFIIFTVSILIAIYFITAQLCKIRKKFRMLSNIYPS